MSVVVTRRPIFGRQGIDSKTGYWLQVSIDGAEPIGSAHVYLRGDTRGPRVPHPEISKLAAQMDAAVLTVEPKRLMTDERREQLILACAECVADAMQKDRQFAIEAACEGRIALMDMNDADLIEYAQETWQIITQLN